MNNDSTIMGGVDSLARRMVSRIWNSLPEGHRTPTELRNEALQLASSAALNFKPGQNPYAALREIYPNAGRPWKKADDEELRRLFLAENSIEDLVPLFGRSPNGVRQRLIRIGLIMDEASAAA